MSIMSEAVKGMSVHPESAAVRRGGLLPLSMANHGEMVQIQKINGRDDTRRFLEGLGFVPGAQVMVVARNGDNLIIKVKESRVAVSGSMANRIMV